MHLSAVNCRLKELIQDSQLSAEVMPLVSDASSGSQPARQTIYRALTKQQEIQVLDGEVKEAETASNLASKANAQHPTEIENLESQLTKEKRRSGSNAKGIEAEIRRANNRTDGLAKKAEEKSITYSRKEALLAQTLKKPIDQFKPTVISDLFEFDFAEERKPLEHLVRNPLRDFTKYLSQTGRNVKQIVENALKPALLATLLITTGTQVIKPTPLAPTLQDQLRQIGNVEYIRPSFTYDNIAGNITTHIEVVKDGKPLSIPVSFNRDSHKDLSMTGVLTTTNPYSTIRHVIKPTLTKNNGRTSILLTSSPIKTFHSPEHKDKSKNRGENWKNIVNIHSLIFTSAEPIDTIASVSYGGMELLGSLTTHLINAKTVRAGKTNTIVVPITLSSLKKDGEVYVRSDAREWKIGIIQDPRSFGTFSTQVHFDYEEAVAKIKTELNLNGPYSAYAGFEVTSANSKEATIRGYLQKDGRPYKFERTIPSGAFGATIPKLNFSVKRQSEDVSYNIEPQVSGKGVRINSINSSDRNQAHVRYRKSLLEKTLVKITPRGDEFSGRYHPISRISNIDVKNTSDGLSFVTVNYESDQPAGIMHTELAFNISTHKGYDNMPDATLRTEKGTSKIALRHLMGPKGYAGTRVDIVHSPSHK
ncbi:MAG: hypothetical protein ACI8Y7_000685 [Candidatus Woesearchaeota archaeon]|jgi:hypothetical protein